MIDLFSTEFLDKLKSESYSKAKPSKALLNAIQQLSQENLNKKKRIIELEQYIKDLQQQNSLLVELLDAAKNDYSASLETKEERIKALISREAKLQAQNEILSRKITNYEVELSAYKEMALRLKSTTQIGSREDLRLSGITISKKTIQGSYSEFDLQAYLTNEKKNLLTSRCKTNKSIQQKIEDERISKDNMSGFQENVQENVQMCSNLENAGKTKNGTDYSQLDSSLLGHLLNENN